MSYSSFKPTEQIAQIVPAEGWYAEFAAEDGRPYHVRLAAWALVERFDSGSVRRELRGLGPWNSPHMDLLDTVDELVRYVHQSSLAGAQLSDVAAGADAQARVLEEHVVYLTRGRRRDPEPARNGSPAAATPR
jgi:hypothetical protein